MLGEGAVLMILESREHAQRSGRKILAEIAGFGSYFSPEGFSSAHQNLEAATGSMLQALEAGQSRPEEVDYVCASSNGSRIGDRQIRRILDKAIRDANLGYNPQSDKDLVRVPIPPLTEERRKEIVKQVKGKGEDHKIAIRNHRRDAKELIEAGEKDGDIAGDEAKKSLDKMQKETDEGIKKIDEIVAAKEKEVMQV